jgi:endonuclease-3 related protein
MEGLPAEAGLFNEFHALFVKTGKDFCKAKNPRCAECPLGEYL